MTYKFRIGWETLWFVAIAALTPALQALLNVAGIGDFTPDFIDGLVAASIRAVAAAILSVIGGQVLLGDNVLLDRSNGEGA